MDKGTVEKMIKDGKVSAEESKNLSGTELTLELKDSDVTIQRFTEKDQDLIEIADVNGTFALWFTPTAEKIGRLRNITE